MDRSATVKPHSNVHELTERIRDTEIYTLVTPNDLKLDPLVDKVSDNGAGAIATFSGVTRNTFDGKGVLRLEYEAYEPMALKKMMVRAALTEFPHQLKGLSLCSTSTEREALDTEQGWHTQCPSPLELILGCLTITGYAPGCTAVTDCTW